MYMNLHVHVDVSIYLHSFILQISKAYFFSNLAKQKAINSCWDNFQHFWLICKTYVFMPRMVLFFTCDIPNRFLIYAFLINKFQPMIGVIGTLAVKNLTTQQRSSGSTIEFRLTDQHMIPSTNISTIRTSYMYIACQLHVYIHETK